MTRYLSILFFGLFSLPCGAEEAPLPPRASDEHVRMFQQDLAGKAQWAKDNQKSAVPGKDGWLFFPGELRHISVGEFWGDRAAEVSTASKPEWADPLPAIVDFHKQLEELGIELVLMPIPPKAIIYPEQVSDLYNEKIAPAYEGKTPRLDPAHQAFYEALREQGVNVIDLTPDLLALKQTAKHPVYLAQDTHYAAPAIKLAAARIKALTEAEAWYKAEEKQEYLTTDKTIEITGDLWRFNQDPELPKEKATLTYVGDPVKTDPTSPVLLIGDSHLLVFHIGEDMHAVGAGLAEHTTKALGMPVDVIGVRGSGATPSRFNLIRKAYRDPAYLTNKKLIVWVLTAREFTETTGWRPLPVTKKK